MPIDGTDIICSISVIGRKLHFSIDIDLNTLPQMNQYNNQATLDSFKLIDSSRYFWFSILKIIIQDRRMAHAQRINNNRNIFVLQSSDIVIALTAIQNDISKNKEPNCLTLFVVLTKSSAALVMVVIL